MNPKRILQLADYLEALPEDEFNMRRWVCGTTACIGGHCERMVMGSKIIPDSSHYFVLSNRKLPCAKIYLELTDEQEDDLFYPRIDHNGLTGDLNSITLPMAIKTLRNFAATGNIKWSVPA
tara:strand:- start:36546 stop:36908 length:363 start_codon:yes stop_codon:yes gene_type:complete